MWNKIIVAGNVAREMVEELILNGKVDIVKSELDPSACLTRLKTGVGMPQLSAVISVLVQRTNKWI